MTERVWRRPVWWQSFHNSQETGFRSCLIIAGFDWDRSIGSFHDSLPVSTGTAAWAVFTAGYSLSVSTGTAAWAVFTAGCSLPVSAGTAAWAVFTAGCSLSVSTRAAVWEVFTTVTTADLKYEIYPFKIQSSFCVPPALTFSSSVFCSQGVFMRCVQFS